MIGEKWSLGFKRVKTTEQTNQQARTLSRLTWSDCPVVKNKTMNKPWMMEAMERTMVHIRRVRMRQFWVGRDILAAAGAWKKQ